MADTPVQILAQVSLDLRRASRQLKEFAQASSARLDIVNEKQAISKIQRVGKEAQKATTFAEKFGDALALKTEQFAVYTVAAAAIGKVTFELARATREAIRFEQELVRLSQVFDNSVDANDDLRDSIRRLAIEYGQSANQLARTSVILAQTGLSAEETSDALEALTKTTLAATFSNIERTTEGAVAIMNQFRIEASELAGVMDTINSVSKEFAVESNDIIEAVKRAGGAFKAAGGEFEEFVALFTSVRSTTRETAETIGTGFRTIFARLQRPKVIDYFRELGIELETVGGNFVGPLEAVQRISDGLARLGIVAGQTRFAEVVEQLGGLRQVARVIPLLGETAKAQEALAVAGRSAGSVAEDAAKAQETLAVRFDQTKQRFEDLVFRITQTGSFQALADIFLRLANSLITLGDTLKDVLPLLIALQGLRIGTALAKGTRRIFGGDGNSQLARPPFQIGGVFGFSAGSKVPGAGNRDSVLAALTPGEVVLNRRQQNRLGEIYGSTPDRIFSALKVPGFAKGGRVGVHHFQDGGVVPDDPFEAFLRSYGIDETSLRQGQERNDRLRREAEQTEQELIAAKRKQRRDIERRIAVSKRAREVSADPLGGPSQRRRAGAQKGRRTQQLQRESLALSEAGIVAGSSLDVKLQRNAQKNKEIILKRQQTNDRTLQVEQRLLDEKRKEAEAQAQLARQRRELQQKAQTALKSFPTSATGNIATGDDLRQPPTNVRTLGPPISIDGKFGPAGARLNAAINNFTNVLSRGADKALPVFDRLTKVGAAASTAAFFLQATVDPTSSLAKDITSLSNVVLQSTVAFGVLRTITEALASAKTRELLQSLAQSGRGLLKKAGEIGNTPLSELFTRRAGPPGGPLIGFGTAIAGVTVAAIVANEAIRRMAEASQEMADLLISEGAEGGAVFAGQAEVQRRRSPFTRTAQFAAVGGAAAGPVGLLVGGIVGALAETVGVFDFVNREAREMAESMARSKIQVVRANKSLKRLEEQQKEYLEAFDIKSSTKARQNIIDSFGVVSSRLVDPGEFAAAKEALSEAEGVGKTVRERQADSILPNFLTGLSEDVKLTTELAKAEKEKLDIIEKRIIAEKEAFGQAFALARRNNTLEEQILKANNNKKLLLDSENTIVRDSIAAGSEFEEQFLQLAEVVGETEALNQLSATFLQNAKIIEDAGRRTEKAFKSLESDLITFRFGSVEDKLTRLRGFGQARQISTAVARGDLRGIGLGQRQGFEFLQQFLGTGLRIGGRTAEQTLYGDKGLFAQDLAKIFPEASPEEIKNAVKAIRDAAKIDMDMLAESQTQTGLLRGIGKALGVETKEESFVRGERSRADKQARTNFLRREINRRFSDPEDQPARAALLGEVNRGTLTPERAMLIAENTSSRVTYSRTGQKGRYIDPIEGAPEGTGTVVDREQFNEFKRELNSMFSQMNQTIGEVRDTIPTKVQHEHIIQGQVHTTNNGIGPVGPVLNQPGIAPESQGT